MMSRLAVHRERDEAVGDALADQVVPPLDERHGEVEAGVAAGPEPVLGILLVARTVEVRQGVTFLGDGDGSEHTSQSAHSTQHTAHSTQQPQ